MPRHGKALSLRLLPAKTSSITPVNNTMMIPAQIFALRVTLTPMQAIGQILKY
jgi:hypothetical protein